MQRVFHACLFSLFCSICAADAWHNNRSDVIDLLQVSRSNDSWWPKWGSSSSSSTSSSRGNSAVSSARGHAISIAEENNYGVGGLTGQLPGGTGDYAQQVVNTGMSTALNGGSRREVGRAVKRSAREQAVKYGEDNNYGMGGVTGSIPLVGEHVQNVMNTGVSTALNGGSRREVQQAVKKSARTEAKNFGEGHNYGVGGFVQHLPMGDGVQDMINAGVGTAIEGGSRNEIKKETIMAGVKYAARNGLTCLVESTGLPFADLLIEIGYESIVAGSGEAVDGMGTEKVMRAAFVAMGQVVGGALGTFVDGSVGFATFGVFSMVGTHYGGQLAGRLFDSLAAEYKRRNPRLNPLDNNFANWAMPQFGNKAKTIDGLKAPPTLQQLADRQEAHHILMYGCSLIGACWEATPEQVAWAMDRLAASPLAKAARKASQLTKKKAKSSSKEDKIRSEMKRLGYDAGAVRRVEAEVAGEFSGNWDAYYKAKGAKRFKLQ